MLRTRSVSFDCTCWASVKRPAAIRVTISTDMAGHIFNVVMIDESKPSARAPHKIVSDPKKTLRFGGRRQAAPTSKSPDVYLRPTKFGIAFSAKSKNRGMFTGKIIMYITYYWIFCLAKTTVDSGQCRDVIVKQWCSWAMFGHLFKVIH